VGKSQSNGDEINHFFEKFEQGVHNPNEEKNDWLEQTVRAGHWVKEFNYS